VFSEVLHPKNLLNDSINNILMIGGINTPLLSGITTGNKKLGINTNPLNLTYTFEVNSPISNSVKINSNTNSTNLELMNSGGSVFIKSGNKNMTLQTDTTALVYLKGDVNRVGILTMNPEQALQVAGTIRIDSLDNTLTPVKLVGSNASNDLTDVKLGTGLSISNDTLKIADNIINSGDTATLLRKDYLGINTNVLVWTEGNKKLLPYFTQVYRNGQLLKSDSQYTITSDSIVTLEEGSYRLNDNITIIAIDNVIALAGSGGIITLQGDVSGSGTNTITTTIGTSKVTNTMLAGNISNNKLDVITTAGKVSNSATTATNLNTNNAIVSRDGSGNFIASTITANLSGNANTATTLATGRTLAITGDLTYTSPSFNGSANVTAAGTLANSGVTANTYTAATITVDAKGRVTSASNNTIPTVNNGTLTLAVSGSGLTGSQSFTANQSSNATFTVTSNATNANTPSTIVFRDASGNFSANIITAANGFLGNATSSTNATFAANVTNYLAPTESFKFRSNNNNTGSRIITFPNGDITVARTDAAQTFTGIQTFSSTISGSINGNAATVTSVTPSNFASQTANTVLAAPNGSSGTPTFRSLVSSDIPNLNYLPLTGGTLTGGLSGTTGSFASSGGSNTFAINHSSGSGIALYITKGGSGEGLYINKTSGSGNAATIIGTLNATTLVKNNGLSTEFLKANGSVDNNTYLTTGTASSTYLPLTGGTLTGALTGTTAEFISESTQITLRHSGTGQNNILFKSGSNEIFKMGIASNNSSIIFENLPLSQKTSGFKFYSVNGLTKTLGLDQDINGNLGIKSESTPSSLHPNTLYVNGTLGVTGVTTFNSTVNGITKSMVGLSNVDNTTDLNKPVSTATQTALNLKQNTLTNPVTGTGTINYIPKFTATGSTIGNSTLIDNGTTISTASILSTTNYASFNSTQVMSTTSGLLSTHRFTSANANGVYDKDYFLTSYMGAPWQGSDPGSGNRSKPPIIAIINNNDPSFINSGLHLMTTNSTNNTYTPAITFGVNSENGSYYNTISAITAKKLNTGQFTSQSAGQLEFFGTGTSADATGASMTTANMTVGVGVGIGYTTAPTVRGRLIVSERIGINQSTPNFTLDVGGTLNTTGAATINNVLTINSGASNGLLLNGTSSQFIKVYSSNSSFGNAGTWYQNATTGQTEGSDGLFVGIVGGTGSYFTNYENSKTYFRTFSNSNQLVLDTDGNVGIGVEDATNKLDINGTLRVRTTNTVTPTTILGRDNTGVVGGIVVGSGLSLTSGTLSLASGGGFVTTNSDYTVTITDTWIVFNNNFSNITVTLPDATTSLGRTLYFRNAAAGSIVSAGTANIINNNVTTGPRTNDILGAGNTSVKWCTLVSNGTYWIKMQTGSF
jgi:hypothetical protein